MAIKLEQDELQFIDIQDLWMKAKNLSAKMLSKYFNFEIQPFDQILIESMLIQEDYALITAVYLKIPLRFRLTVYQSKVKLEVVTTELTFEEKIEGGNEDESCNVQS